VKIRWIEGSRFQSLVSVGGTLPGEGQYSHTGIECSGRGPDSLPFYILNFENWHPFHIPLKRYPYGLSHTSVAERFRSRIDPGGGGGGMFAIRICATL